MRARDFVIEQCDARISSPVPCVARFYLARLFGPFTWFVRLQPSELPLPRLVLPLVAPSARGTESKKRNPFPPDGRTLLRTGLRHARRRFRPPAWDASF